MDLVLIYSRKAFRQCTVDMGTGGMIYIPILMTIDTNIEATLWFSSAI
jgi:hypothetical protein